MRVDTWTSSLVCMTMSDYLDGLCFDNLNFVMMRKICVLKGHADMSVLKLHNNTLHRGFFSFLQQVINQTLNTVSKQPQQQQQQAQPAQAQTLQLAQTTQQPQTVQLAQGSQVVTLGASGQLQVSQ